jgi:hypothetical protein
VRSLPNSKPDFRFAFGVTSGAGTGTGTCGFRILVKDTLLVFIGVLKVKAEEDEADSEAKAD